VARARGRTARLAAAALALSAACGDREVPPPIVPGGPVAGWPTWGGDPGGTRHSPLVQIDRSNVRLLERAWSYRTGHTPGSVPDLPRVAFQATLVLGEGTLYGCTPANRVFALDAETGAERWRFDAHPDLTGTVYTATCRGVALWPAGEGAGAPAAADPEGTGRAGDAPDGAPPACTRRVFAGTMDGRLLALDAADGRPCAGFGRAGELDLREGLGDVRPGEYGVTSPPTVVGDAVAVGALVLDNRRTDAPGGVVRAFDARTGALRWAFDPRPPGAPPPSAPAGPRWTRGTPNAWAPFAADPARGLLFVPTGNPGGDFYGGGRAGNDHFGSSVVALDAATGRVVWRFQTVHHDLWDYDVASQPLLLELERGGRRVPALLQATKLGHLFLLDRETGAPLHPVEERPVPASDVPGETASPTQPFPTFPAPLHPARLDPADAFGFTPWDRGACRRALAALRNEGMFTPPSLRGSVLYPGTAGGVNWGSVALDPERGLAVLALNRIAQSIRLVPRDAPPVEDEPGPQRILFPQEGTPYRVVSEVVTSPLGVPCAPPPWGTLLAVDLASGRVAWEVPFGSVRDMTLLPIPWNVGLPHMGGPISTASGLVFVGAAMDDYLRAYDVETGAELWRARLPAGGQATPMTYRLRPDGRQLVVIAAGGHGTLGTSQGDWVVAFALPGRGRR
jgi:quinoprotein glucose dehydrogenase